MYFKNVKKTNSFNSKTTGKHKNNNGFKQVLCTQSVIGQGNIVPPPNLHD